MSAALLAAPWLVATFALAALLAMLGVLRHARGRGRWLLALQPLLAALLLAALLWPEATPRGTLRVYSGEGGIASGPAGVAVALPGAEAPAEALRVPDLATALRRFPEVDAVQVVGGGLAPHDRDALGARRLVHAAPSATQPRPAFVELLPPVAVRPGAPWTLRGRVAGSQGEVELLDPAGSVVATGATDGEGRFVLQGLSRAPGPMLFDLRLRREGRTLAQAAVPVVAAEVAAPRVLLLAGVPSPETKFLRRWALDAGVALESRVALAPTLGQRRGAAALDAAALAGYDLVIADERSWAWLAPQRTALAAALDDGLGLLLRVTGPLPPRVAQDWRALGVALQPGPGTPRETRLAPDDAPLHAWPLSWADGLPVTHWRDTAGEPVAAWRAQRRGRLGAVWLADSFRLHTRGAAARHAALWSELVGALARADAEPPLRVPPEAWIGRRAELCGLAVQARVQDPQGAVVPLLPRRGCAAFWPRQPGWHRVVSERVEAGSAPASTWFHVPEPAQAAARVAAADARATAALAQRSDRAPVRAPVRWREVLLLAALALAALAWWFERRWRPAEA